MGHGPALRGTPVGRAQPFASRIAPHTANGVADTLIAHRRVAPFVVAAWLTASTSRFVKSNAYMANSGGWITVAPFAVFTPTFWTPNLSV